MRRKTRDELLRGFLAINAMLREELGLLRRTVETRKNEIKRNPNWALQPRAPKGTPEGGEWIGGHSPKQALTRPPQAPSPPPRPARPPANDNLRPTPNRFGPAALLLSADTLLRQVSPAASREQVRDAIRRFNLNPRSTRDVLAARAYVWTTYHGGELPGVPFAGPGNERAAQALMRFEREAPGTLALAEAGDQEAQALVMEVTRAASENTSPHALPVVPQTSEEADYVAAMRGAGRKEAEVSIALSSIQRSHGTRRARRRRPGVAHSTGSLIPAGSSWLGESNASGAGIPREIADRLRGRYFANSDRFREALWKAIADTPSLASQFDPRDLVRMRNGGAPIAPQGTWHGGLRNYIVHHTNPIGRGGRVYDMSNMLIVTPLLHQQILDPRLHFRPDGGQ